MRAALLLISTLASCSSQQDAASVASELPGIKDRSTLSITLVRTACYGTCPMYGIEIEGDGTVTYCGLHFVKEVGERRRQIHDAELSALVDQFHAANFFSLQNEYASAITDNPTYAIALAYDGKEKSVVDYVGVRAGMPASVTALEDAIDRVAVSSEWIGAGSLGYASKWPACAERFGFEPPLSVTPDYPL